MKQRSSPLKVKPRLPARQQEEGPMVLYVKDDNKNKPVSDQSFQVIHQPETWEEESRRLEIHCIKQTMGNSDC